MKIAYLSSPYVSFHKTAQAYRWCLRRLGHEVNERPDDADLVVLHGEAHQIPGVVAKLPAIRGRRVVGYVVWEHQALNARQREGLALLDEVWTCSTFCRDILVRHHPRVAVVPHVVAAPHADAAALAEVAAEIGDDGRTFFFYAITRPDDPRKNLDAALAAFARLAPGRPVRLVVKPPPGFDPPALDQPGVVLLRGTWPHARLAALHRLCHAFVNPHRAEGWGLGISEAMAAGRLAIATGWSGNMDYMTPANAMPLPYALVPVDAAARRVAAIDEADAAAVHWAEVDGDALAAAMARAVDDWDALEAMRRRAAGDMLRFGPAPLSDLLAGRLAAIEGRTPAPL